MKVVLIPFPVQRRGSELVQRVSLELHRSKVRHRMNHFHRHPFRVLLVHPNRRHRKEGDGKL